RVVSGAPGVPPLVLEHLDVELLGELPIERRKLPVTVARIPYLRRVGRRREEPRVPGIQPRRETLAHCGSKDRYWTAHTRLRGLRRQFDDERAGGVHVTIPCGPQAQLGGAQPRRRLREHDVDARGPLDYPLLPRPPSAPGRFHILRVGGEQVLDGRTVLLRGQRPPAPRVSRLLCPGQVEVQIDEGVVLDHLVHSQPCRQ